MNPSMNRRAVGALAIAFVLSDFCHDYVPINADYRSAGVRRSYTFM